MKELVLTLSLVVSVFAQEDSIRYFGGESEVKADIVKSAIYTAPVLITEEVFSAKDTKEIDMALEKQNQKRVDSGEVAVEFMNKPKGHLFGGISEGNLNF